MDQPGSAPPARPSRTAPIAYGASSTSPCHFRGPVANGFGARNLPLTTQIAAAPRIGDAHERATDWSSRAPTHKSGVSQ